MGHVCSPFQKHVSIALQTYHGQWKILIKLPLIWILVKPRNITAVEQYIFSRGCTSICSSPQWMLLRKEIKESEAYKLEKEARGALEFPGVPLEKGGKMQLRSISFFWLLVKRFSLGSQLGKYMYCDSHLIYNACCNQPTPLSYGHWKPSKGQKEWTFLCVKLARTLNHWTFPDVPWELGAPKRIGWFHANLHARFCLLVWWYSQTFGVCFSLHPNISELILLFFLSFFPGKGWFHHLYKITPLR